MRRSRASAARALLIGVLYALSPSALGQTGGDIGGLIPAPKILNGKIEDSIYISPAQDFRVAVPHKEGTEEFRYLQVKEQASDLSTYVSFGPAALDRRIFRLELTKFVAASRPAVEDVAEQLFQSYIAQIEKAYETPCKRLVMRPSSFEKGRGVFALFVQEIQPRRRFLQPDIAGETRAHALYILDYRTHAALFWVEVPQSDEKTRDLIASEQYTPVRTFIESLSLRQ